MASLLFLLTGDYSVCAVTFKVTAIGNLLSFAYSLDKYPLNSIGYPPIRQKGLPRLAY